jgi:thioredoxin reductase (NADPH)
MMYDCLVIGGGPAGLTAAIYLARFHLSVIVVDHGQGRAASIPITHNHAGFPEGIPGHDLVRRMRLQAERYGAQLRIAEVTSLKSNGDSFIATANDDPIIARAVLLATGVVNHRPPMSDELHADALAKGLIRYCPVCDGFEITDKHIGVLGTGERAFNEALFLRSFTSRITLIAPEGAHDLTGEQLLTLARYRVEVFAGPVAGIELDDDKITLKLTDRVLTFASIYAALGSDVRSELAAALGVTRTAAGCVEVDRHQRTTVTGLYAAGDVVLGLDQISSAMGQASVAATTIRNDLCEQRIILRS